MGDQHSGSVKGFELSIQSNWVTGQANKCRSSFFWINSF